MAHVQRDRHLELRAVPRHHGGPRVRPPGDDGLGVRALDPGELGRHVGVLGPEDLIGHDGHAHGARQSLQLLTPCRAKGIRHGEDGHPGEAVLLGVLVDPLDRQQIALRGLEGPRLDRIDDLAAPPRRRGAGSGPPRSSG
ncbi:MAG: hypothetical protein MZV64_27870 [Ignavibacteriales bacterium]|nr:hypothetical protein [Ignavibacteriales bacterium]